LEENVDGIENETSGVGSVTGTLQFNNITRFNGLDSLLGSLKGGHSSGKLFVGLFLLKSNSVFLGNTSLSDSSDFRSLNIGLLILNFELSKEGSSLVSSNLEGCILLLKVDLELINTTGGFSEFLETVVNVLFLNINCLELIDVKFLVHGDEGEVRLGGNIDVTTHLLVVDAAHFSDQLMDLTHVDDELILDRLRVLDLEGVQEFV